MKGEATKTGKIQAASLPVPSPGDRYWLLEGRFEATTNDYSALSKNTVTILP
jgi:hypothetical protein